MEVRLIVANVLAYALTIGRILVMMQGDNALQFLKSIDNQFFFASRYSFSSYLSAIFGLIITLALILLI